jgi:hypothetical protein
MRKLAIAALLLVGAGPPQQAETIGGDVRSWGKVVEAFEIAPSGEVRHTIAQQDGGFHEYWLVTRRAQAGVDAYRKVAALTARARALAGTRWECQPGPTDGPYGELRSGSARVSYRSSCIAHESGTVASAIGESLALAKEWTKDAEIVSREWKGPPRP